MQKHTILFLAANPSNTDRLALDQEARAIEFEFERSRYRERFEFVTRWAVQPLDLLHELRKLKPTVVHFSGHGARGAVASPRNGERRRDVENEFRDVRGDAKGGLYFQDANGMPQLVSGNALKETFRAAGTSVRLVVLNACDSEIQARALVAHVDCVVGMSGAISDHAARSFAIGLYGGLAECESVGAACGQGCAAISLEGASGSDRPQLYARGDIKADEYALTDVVTRVTDLARYERTAIQQHIAQYSRTLTSDPRDRDALRAVGICYLELGLHAVAEQFFCRLIDAHPAEPAGYFYRAICVLGGKRPRTLSLPIVRKSEQLVDTARALDPTIASHDVLLAALRHDYYAVNGLRVPAPTPEELIASARTKRVDSTEVAEILRLLGMNDGSVKRWFSS